MRTAEEIDDTHDPKAQVVVCPDEKIDIDIDHLCGLGGSLTYGKQLWDQGVSLADAVGKVVAILSARKLQLLLDTKPFTGTTESP